MPKLGALDEIYQYVKNKLPQKGFFSTLDELIGSAPIPQAPPDQWRSYLQPGKTVERAGVSFPLKKEEIDYSGLHDYLSSLDPTAPLTKDDLRSAIQERRPGFKVGVRQYPAEGLGDNLRRKPDLIADLKSQLGDRTSLEGNPNFGDYAHDSPDYQESLTKSTDFGRHNTHFTPDVLSHSRTTGQETPEGKLVRLIEEIQSDRHSDAREKVDPQVSDEFYNRIRSYPQYARWSRPDDMGLSILAESGPSELQSEAQAELNKFKSSRRGYRTPEDQTRIDQAIQGSAEDRSEITLNDLDRLKNKVPDAPFKSPEDYATLELKKQLLNAVNNDQDYLALTRGADQTARYEGGMDDTRRSGMNYIYDQIYPSALQKLAKRYGASVGNVTLPLKSNVDTRPSNLIEAGAEHPSQLLDDALENGDTFATLRELIEEYQSGVPELSNLGDHAMRQADRLEDLRDSGRLDPEATQFHPVEAALRESLDDLHGAWNAKYSWASSNSKTFPALELTPELKQKIRDAGVPLWSLAGAAAAGLGASDDSDAASAYAEGGSIEPTGDDTALKALTAAARGFGGPENPEARAHLLEGLASQLYGIDKDNNLKFLGGKLDEPPGVIDNALALPTILGSHAPQFSLDAQDRLERLKKKLYAQMQLKEPEGAIENLASAAGTMAGQLPIPAGAVKGVVSKLPKLLSTPLKLISPATEWLSPTIDPKLKNYAIGTLFGGGAGALSDSLRNSSESDDSTPTPDIMNRFHYAEGGKVGNLISNLRALAEKFSIPPLSEFEHAKADQWAKQPGTMSLRIQIPPEKLGDPDYFSSPDFHNLVQSQLGETLADQSRHPELAKYFSVAGLPEPEDLSPIVDAWHSALREDDGTVHFPTQKADSGFHVVPVSGPAKLIKLLTEEE